MKIKNAWLLKLEQAFLIFILIFIFILKTFSLTSPYICQKSKSLLNMKYTFIILSSIFLWAACKNEPTKQEPKKQPAAVIEQSDTYLFCQPVETTSEESDAPAYEVFLQLAESKWKVADILNCETISPDQYDQHQIPKQAISAVGGWWAGAGDYLYLMDQDSQFVVKKGGMDEAQEGVDYNYQEVAKYTKKGFMTND